MITTMEEYWRAYPDTYGETISGGKWTAYRWLQYVSERITPIIRKGNGRIILNAPPRMGKSRFVTVRVPVWYLERNPHHNVMVTSAGDSLSKDFGRESRDVAKSSPLCRVRLREDKNAAGQWMTPEGGGMISLGAGGQLTGRGFHLGIIDDAYKNMLEATSPGNQEKLISWFNSAFYTRAEPDATIIVAMTRWHADDLCGWLIEEHEDDWEVISLPALAEEGDPMGRQPGESLCPERYPSEKLERVKKAVGVTVWNALYTQKPDPIGAGKVFKKFAQVDHVDKTLAIRPELPVHVSWDFNLNPGMHCVIGQYDPRPDVFTAVHELHGPRWDVEDTIKSFITQAEGMGIGKQQEIHVFGDASGHTGNMVTSESCYQAIFRELGSAGYRSVRRTPRANPNVRGSIDAFNDALKGPDGKVHYRVHPRCERLLADFKGLKLDVNGDIDKTEASLSHSADAERYRVWMIRPLIAPSQIAPGRVNVRRQR